MTTIDEYGTTSDGRTVHSVKLRAGDTTATFLDYGARLLELWLPDRAGRLADVVLGYSDIAAHEAGTAYFGATCGRYANRIRGGRFRLGDEDVHVDVNEGPNHLHGGHVGFDRHVWTFETDGDDRVRFQLLRPDGDQGFPGAVRVGVDVLLGSRSLDITMSAQTTRLTVMNMVNHAYWNLAGAASGTVLDHLLCIDADFYTPVDTELLPTGEVRRVEGTPYDFRRPTPIGREIRHVVHDAPGRAAPGGLAGYDHNWVLREASGELRRCATAVDPTSGRAMELWSNEAGVQMYTAGYLSSDVIGKHGEPYAPFQGFTLETQRFPDSPNIGHFPSARLAPGERYEHVMSFRFSTD
jgi:aldose 1-epimerase